MKTYIRAIDIVSQIRLATGLANGRYQFDEDGELEKRCSKCREYWPADTEFYFAFAGCTHRDGLHCMCKSCVNESRKAPRPPYHHKELHHAF